MERAALFRGGFFCYFAKNRNPTKTFFNLSPIPYIRIGKRGKSPEYKKFPFPKRLSKIPVKAFP
ncbi:MAG: hypothetical protein BHW65_03940 [Verrucomicrobia bacterium CAG:312_58_20]|nr:MAG: hypothetical protein BHW65_03940 [Verrucomicrobia bacterium CAG:312_58_20]